MEKQSYGQNEAFQTKKKWNQPIGYKNKDYNNNNFLMFCWNFTFFKFSYPHTFRFYFKSSTLDLLCFSSHYRSSLQNFLFIYFLYWYVAAALNYSLFRFIIPAFVRKIIFKMNAITFFIFTVVYLTSKLLTISRKPVRQNKTTIKLVINQNYFKTRMLQISRNKYLLNDKFFFLFHKIAFSFY